MTSILQDNRIVVKRQALFAVLRAVAGIFRNLRLPLDKTGFLPYIFGIQYTIKRLYYEP
jgi:hypothetical protein